mgnify:FL=1
MELVISNSNNWQDVARFTQVAHNINDAPAFAGAKAKVNRARLHMAEVERMIEGHLASDWFSIDRFSEDEIPVVQIEVFSPGFELSAAIGDCVHNLRSALDHLAVSCVEVVGGNTRNVYFPFAPDEETLEASIRRANFHRAPPEALDLLRSYKPYRNGNIALRALHDLDVTAKHKALVPAIGSTKITGVIDPAKNITQDDITVETPRLVFHSDGPLGNEEILPTLTSILELIESIVDAFETLLIPSSDL